MDLLVFIGHHKVGSSALQSYLATNAISLLGKDVLYPAVEGQGLATLLSMALHREEGQPDWPSEFAQPINLREAHNALAFGMMAAHRGTEVNPLHQGLPRPRDMLTIIRRQVEVLSPETVILAAEVFSNFGGMSPKLIRHVFSPFDDPNVTLTATFRRVDDYLVSWHGQRLRFGQAPRPLEQALARYQNTIHFNYRKLLEPWIKVRPEAALRIRNYKDVLASGGSVEDFMNGFGLPLPQDPALMPRVNESISCAFYDLMTAANDVLEKSDARQFFEYLINIGPKLDLPKNRDIEMFGQAARDTLVESFEPIHTWLSEINGVPAFFPDFDEMARVRPVAKQDAAQSAIEQLRGPIGQDVPEPAKELVATFKAPGILDQD